MAKQRNSTNNPFAILQLDSPFFLSAFNDIGRSIWAGEVSPAAAQVKAYERLRRWAAKPAEKTRVPVDDIVQETIHRLAELDLETKYDITRGTVSAFVRGVMRNVCIELARKLQVQGAATLGLPASPRNPCPLKSLIQKEQLSILWLVWPRLSKLQKDAICRKFGPIFEHVVLPGNKDPNEDQRRHRGLRRLSTLLERYGVDGL